MTIITKRSILEFIFMLGGLCLSTTKAGILYTSDKSYNTNTIRSISFYEKNDTATIFFKNNTNKVVNLNDMKVVDFRSQSTNENIAAQFSTNAKIHIYPNPVDDNLNINGLDYNSNIKIFSAEGKIIFSQLINNTPFTINVSSFPKGIYFIKINNDKAIKFIKR